MTRFGTIKWRELVVAVLAFSTYFAVPLTGGAAEVSLFASKLLTIRFRRCYETSNFAWVIPTLFCLCLGAQTNVSNSCCASPSIRSQENAYGVARLIRSQTRHLPVSFVLVLQRD